MSQKRWTFLFIKDEASPVRQFSVPARAGHYLASVIGGGVLLLTSLVMIVSIDGWSRLDILRLTSENETLTTEIAGIQSRVHDLEGTLDLISDRDARYRVLAGLESLDAEVLQVGVGGPGWATPESGPLWETNPEAGKAMFAASYDLFALDRRALLLSESLAEATDSLKSYRNALLSTPSILPAAGLLSSAFSKARFHPIYQKELPHQGIDLSAPLGTTILAAANGSVTYAGWRSGFGNTVEIEHGFGYMTRYAHASKILVQKGQRVERGERIAEVGRTGIATAPNLHYEVWVDGKPVNPLNYVISGAIP
jgi:Peptidase family M23